MTTRGLFYGVTGAYSVIDTAFTKTVYMVGLAGMVREIIYSGTPTDLEVLHVKSEGRLTFSTPFEADARDPGGVNDLPTFQKIDIVYKN